MSSEYIPTALTMIPNDEKILFCERSGYLPCDFWFFPNVHNARVRYRVRITKVPNRIDSLLFCMTSFYCAHNMYHIKPVIFVGFTNNYTRIINLNLRYHDRYERK